MVRLMFSFPQSRRSRLESDMTPAKSPDLEARLFSYAVITDTHLNQGEDECNSPFGVNKLANGRMRFDEIANSRRHRSPKWKTLIPIASTICRHRLTRVAQER